MPRTTTRRSLKDTNGTLGIRMTSSSKSVALGSVVVKYTLHGRAFLIHLLRS